MAVGRDEDLFTSADAELNQHIRGELGYGRDPAGSLAYQRKQRPISQAEGARKAFRFDKGIGVMNAYDVISRQHRTEISKAENAGRRIPRQNELVPGMTEPNFVWQTSICESVGVAIAPGGKTSRNPTRLATSSSSEHISSSEATISEA